MVNIELIIDNLKTEVESQIEGHMKKQPFSAFCGVCMADLVIESATVDSAFDLTLEITPCPNCCKG